jgi:poly-gamma-glutamate capsule biosynthesis protein CapA/YwtB (metallophosphatase superfamily)
MGRCSSEVMPVQKTLKALGATLAVIALCSPLIFWPVDDAQPSGMEASTATVTVPATVAVSTTLPPSQTTTTVSSPEPTSSTTTTTEPINITIAAVGDVLTHLAVINSVRDSKTGSYNFGPIFSPIAPYLRAADYTVANLETRLAGPAAGYSGYPRFNSPGELAFALKDIGVDLAATANNHSLDMGWDGIVKTLDKLDAASVSHVGTYRTAAEKSKPFIADIGGIRVAFLNYTESLNGLPVPEDHPYAVDILDVDQAASDAATARLWGADVVIAILHYGYEYEREPSEAQTKISRELLSRGVDVILGAHPHVVQPISHIFEFSGWKVTDKYIVYSLGNFVSNQPWRYSDSGIVAYVHIEKRGLRAFVTGVSYLPVYVQRGSAHGRTTYRVLPVLPGLEPSTDVPLSDADRQRMAAVWEELRPLLYSPNEGVSPLDPTKLGLFGGR